jgi:hypothetical protein
MVRLEPVDAVEGTITFAFIQPSVGTIVRC